MRTMEGSKNPLPAVDEDGFLTQTETWTPEVAEVLAEDEVPGGLTDDHWKVVNYVREYYLEVAMIPPVRMLSRRTGFTLRQMKKMFPHGLAKGACRIAGIPSHAIKPSFLYP